MDQGNNEHGDGFEAGLREHDLFLEVTIETLKKATLELKLSDLDHDLRAEDYLNDQSREYLDEVLPLFENRSSDWRIGFVVGFQTAHKNLLKILGSN